MQWRRYCALLKKTWQTFKKVLRKSLKKRNEEIHNRHITCIVASAGNDCSRIKDHGQRLDQTWSPDQDQWPEAASSKPHDSRIK